MKKFKLIKLLLTISFVLAIVGIVNAQNWTGWRGNDRNGTVAGFAKPAAWPSQLTKVWEMKVGLGDASPVMAKNQIFLLVKIDTTEVVVCLDAAKGKEIWRSNLNPSPNITGPAIGHPGPRSTPFIDKGKLYTLGAGGVVTCIDSKNGKIVWKNDAFTSEVPQFFTGCSPLVYDGKCIVQLGGKNKGVIVAFDAKSGKELWKLEGEPTAYSSPAQMAANKNQILVQSETGLLCVSTDGKLVWKIPTPVQRMFYNAPSPVFDGNKVFIAGQGGGTKAYSVTQTGDVWESKELWANKDFGTSFNTPILKDGFLYGNEAKQGKLFCLNAGTGEKAWADGAALNRFASILDLGGVLACLPATGPLIFFEPSATAYVELAKYKVAETDVYAHPLIIGDKIFVKEKEMLTCWSIK